MNGFFIGLIFPTKGGRERRFLFLLGIFMAGAGWAESDWPQFRGENRNGTSGEAGLLGEWPEAGPRLVWNATGIGGGYSSPTIADGTIYITGDLENELVITALGMDGKPRWRVTNGKIWKNPYPGARASCTYEAGRIYHMNAHGRVVCLDARDGAEVWAVDVLERFGAENLRWGMSQNLLLDEDRLIVIPGGGQTMMAALNKATGEIVWKSEPIRFRRDVAFGGKPADPNEEVAEKAGYASPVLMETGGRRLLMGCGGRHLFCVDAQTGKMLWKQMVPATYEVIGAIPLVFGDHVIFTVPGPFGGECFRVRASVEGVKFESAWKTEVDNGHGALVHVDGKIYGSGYKNFKPWFCIDAATGRIEYSREDWEIGSTAWADGRLYGYTQKGRMLLLEPGEGGFIVRGEFQYEEKPKRSDAWAHPVIHDAKLYLRYDDRLSCFDISG